MLNYETLKKLNNIFACSRFEGEILDFIKENLKEKGLSFQETPFGDLYVGRENSRLMLAAHIDEVGLLVTNFFGDGYLQVQPIGWVKPEMVSGRDIELRSEKGDVVPGIIVYDKALKIKEVGDWDTIKLDIGAKNDNDCQQMGIIIPTQGTYKKVYYETKDKVFGSALDNRLGVFLLLSLLSENPQIIQKGIGFGFTTSEEAGFEGSKSLANFVKPEYVCVVDVIPHSYTLHDPKIKNPGEPLIVYKAHDWIAHPDVRNLIKDVPHQKYFWWDEEAKDIEPVFYENFGRSKSFNFCVIANNYHHGTSSCYKESIEMAFLALEKMVGNSGLHFI